MDYWKELNIFESVMQENINNYNLLKLRSCADICSALICNVCWENKSCMGIITNGEITLGN